MSFHFTYNYAQVARDGGFKLRNYKDGPLDWRLIGSIEIERILRDQSFEQIDGVLNHLSEAPLGSILDSNVLDSGIAKYFLLSQFSVQYLLFCRKFLEETVADLRESHNTAKMELATAKRSLSEARNEILQLHKKLTQIEAIHEVLYPCHLCTKNFVSNDSLNLHISRKHSGGSVKPERKPETPQHLCKERDNDLTLINTIKLELEIKQLKERLNNAEREIKEKSNESVAKGSSEKSQIKSVCSIGIQSNLEERKEKDDSREHSESFFFQNSEQICTLMEKLQEFEKWKEDQMLQNSEFLNIINSKIMELTTTFENSRNQRESQINDENQSAFSSTEDLKNMLTKRVEEIGKTTAANLEDFVKKIETNYKEKLQLLEIEVNKMNEQLVLQKELKTNELEHSRPQGAVVQLQSNNSIYPKESKSTRERWKAAKEMAAHSKESQPVKETSTSESNRTFVKSNIVAQQKGRQQIKKSSVSESNRTFVKSNNVINLEPNTVEKSLSTSGMSDEDSTDFSVSLPDEENFEKNFSGEESIHNAGVRNKCIKPRQVKHKVMTKKDAKKLANSRLSSMGVDFNAKTLTPLLKKRYFDNLNERRIKLKETNSQFYAARNKIKKFVDKLCSTKMPSNAEALLKATKHIEPKYQKRSEVELSEEEYTTSVKASTPLSGNPLSESEKCKQRLEHILSSPIRKPDNHIEEAIVNNEGDNQKPIPVPRKRVMFNHPEVQSNI